MYKKLVIRGGIIIFLSNLVCLALGYVRDMLMMKNFGASGTNDAWYIASSIPDVLAKFLLFGALGATFIPIFVKYLKEDKEKEGWLVASSVINFCALIFGLVVIIGIIFSSGIVSVLAPGLNPQTHILAAKLTRIILPVLVLFSISGLLAAVYRSYFHYLIPAINPVLEIIVLVGFIILFASSWGVYSFAWGTIFGTLLALLVSLGFLLYLKKPYKFKIDFQHPALKSILILMIPLIGAEIVGKGISMVDRIFVSYLAPGSVTALNLANRLVTIPINFVSTTIALATFPMLARYAEDEDKTHFKNWLIFSFKSALLIILPCTAGLIILGRFLIQAFFERGAFDAQATTLTWRALFYLAPALIPFSLQPILAPACYALKKNWMLFWSELIGFSINIVLDYILMRFLGISGITLATTLVVTVMVWYVLWMMRKQTGKFEDSGMLLFVGKISSAVFVMAVWAYFCFRKLAYFLPAAGVALWTDLIFTILSSAVVYFIILRVLKLKELGEIWNYLRGSLKPGKSF